MLEMRLASVVLGVIGVEGTSQDCIEFYRSWRDPSQDPVDESLIVCSPEGYCENLYWVDDYAGFGVAVPGQEITCVHASELKDASEPEGIDWMEIPEGVEIVNILSSMEEFVGSEVMGAIDSYPFDPRFVELVDAIIPRLVEMITELGECLEGNGEHVERIAHEISEQFPVLDLWGSAVAILEAMNGSRDSIPVELGVQAHRLVSVYSEFRQLFLPPLSKEYGQLATDPLEEFDEEIRTESLIDAIIDEGESYSVVNVLIRALETGDCYRVNDLIDLAVNSLDPGEGCLIELAKSCYDTLSLSTRMSVLPLAIARWSLDIPSPLVPQAVSVVTHQDYTFAHAASLLSARDRFSNDLQRMQLMLVGSEATGSGPLYEFVSKSLSDALTSDLFTFVDSRNVVVQPNVRQDTLGDLRMVGRLVGLAIAHQVPIYFPLSRGCISVLIDPLHARMYTEEAFEWLQHDNPDRATPLANLKKISPQELEFAQLSFPGDESRIVDHNNLSQYLIDVAVADNIIPTEAGMIEITRGVYDVLPYGQLSWLSVEELSDLFVSAARPVTVAELRAASSVADSQKDFKEIEWFWETLESFSQEQLRNLLQFVSGSRFLPVHGLEASWLGIMVNTVEDARDSLPRAQLCFKQLKLPRYSSKQMLREKLLFAIDNCSTVDIS